MLAKPERKVIIKRGMKADEYWAYCNAVGCDVWGMLTSMDSNYTCEIRIAVNEK